MSMQEDIKRLAATGVTPRVFFFRPDMVEQMLAVLAANVGTDVQLYFREGMRENGDLNWWHEYRDMSTGRTVTTMDESEDCPPLPPSECQ